MRVRYAVIPQPGRRSCLSHFLQLPTSFKVHSSIAWSSGHSHITLLQLLSLPWPWPDPATGGQYLSWLGSARAALEAGMAAFIEKDFDSPLDMLDLPKLLPLLPRLNVLELLGQHHGQ